MRGPIAVGALCFAIILLALTSLSHSTQLDELRSDLKVEKARSAMLSRQVAQLNGRVFLGTDIPDTQSGIQP